LKHLGLTIRFIIKSEKLTKKCTEQNVHQRRFQALQKEINKNQEEVEQALASTLEAILDKHDLRRFTNLIIDLICKVFMQCPSPRNRKLVVEKIYIM
jgi:16S rRNA C1402 N4-methylase RsmH